MTRCPLHANRSPRCARGAAWWLALCALAALLAGCGDAPTRVYVAVEADAALAVDGLVVIAGGDDRRPMPYTPRVELQVPAAWADAPHTVTFEGTHAGAVVARGSVTFTARANDAIDVTVELAALGVCDASCELGATRCVSGAKAVERCDVGPDGCPAWRVADVCGGATPFCADGACVASCQDDCTAGATECDGAGGVRACGNHDGDACLEWSATTGCGAELACTGGVCVATVPLTVVKAGAGSGTVTSTPAGIDCGAACTARFLPGTMVTLTATPAMGATFTGWSGGGCAGTGTCTVTLATATTATATFTGACIDDCTAAATTCTSTSSQATCGNFDADPCTEWSPATACGVNQVCAGSACVATAVVAVVKAGTGAGTVTSSPAGIACGSDCSEAFIAGTSVQLMATPAAGSTFAAWSGGGCAGGGACVVTASSATTVTATFTGPCADECTTGASSCPSTSTERTCGDFDADACTEWSAPIACGADEVCAATACVASTCGTRESFSLFEIPDANTGGIVADDSIFVTGFAAGQRLNDITALRAVCVTVEHSFIGDLSVALRCPSGAWLVLAARRTDFGAYSHDLGVPIANDDANPTPGTGWDYCFSPSATNLSWIPFLAAHSVPSSNALPAGTYQSSDEMTALLACPLNGAWTIRFQDHGLEDQGFVFGWSMRFAPSLVPNCSQ